MRFQGQATGWQRWLCRVLALLGCVTCHPAVAVAKNDPDAVARFAQGVAAYQANDHAGAHGGFSALAREYASPELFANCGSAAYRIGEDGEAVLWYRRVLVMDSRHSEALQNLRFLRRRLGFLTFEDRPLQQYARILRKPAWRVGCAFSGSVTAVCLAFLFCVRLSSRVRGRVIGVAALSGFLAAIAGIGWWAKSSERSLSMRYVVTAPEVTALVAPSDSAGRVVLLPQGSELMLLRERGEWIYADLPGGSRGWLRANQADPLWPFSGRLAE